MEGATEGLKMAYKIFPHILAIMVGISADILTLACLRPMSGGAANTIVMDIFENYGPDSVQGKIASILMGGTEKTFYVITVLYGAVGVKKIRGTMVAALLADLTAIVLSILIVLKGFV